MNTFTNHITTDDDIDDLEEFEPVYDGQPNTPSNKHIPTLPRGYRN